MKIQHPLILVDLNDDGTGRVYCPVAAQLTERELLVAQTFIAEITKNARRLLNGHAPGRYEVKLTKMNTLTRKTHVELTRM